MTAHLVPALCPNCDHAVQGPFCSACGQETVIETPSVTEFLHELLHHYVAAEGKIWRTLHLLLCAPGRLTSEYIAGRRKRYIRPMQLYLTLSFVFFLLSSMTGQFVPEGRPEVVVKKVELPAIVKSEIQADEDGKAALDFGEQVSSLIMGNWNRRVAAAGGDEGRALKAIFDNVLNHVPIALFILMPMLGLLLQLLYLGRKLPYGAHLLFSIHLHAFVFAFLTLMLLPWPGPIKSLLQFFVPACYLLFASKRFYGGRWWPQVLRTGLIGAVYGTLLSLTMGILVSTAFFAS